MKEIRNLMIEVRWHGRGGQGAVTSVELLAVSAISAGKYAQGFPSFGPERRGDAQLPLLHALMTRKSTSVRAFTNPLIKWFWCWIPSLIGLVNAPDGLNPAGN